MWMDWISRNKYIIMLCCNTLYKQVIAHDAMWSFQEYPLLHICVSE